MVVSISDYWQSIDFEMKIELYRSYLFVGHCYFLKRYLAQGAIFTERRLSIGAIHVNTCSESLKALERAARNYDIEFDDDVLELKGRAFAAFFDASLLTILMHEALTMSDVRKLFKSSRIYYTEEHRTEPMAVWFPATLRSSKDFDERRDGLTLHNLVTYAKQLPKDDSSLMRERILTALKNVQPFSYPRLFIAMLDTLS
ncbi:hypothetical protein [Acanthopleuribacter pedis]|uniref:Uncharacterized protein n=1 Tax=Acanthopleuribacter pedis TaxID=442870 RepID=A0A8J7Q7K3_9BACT|nr:hypothetical protein [Acanthopleuribacter pedis]MBO1318789.1 hypothetical protein [Acanthopleuribacter pedis]